MWKLVAGKKECSGSEIGFGWTPDIETCARRCQYKSSMFAYGTNDYDKWIKRCNENGCKCICETAANPDGTCDLKQHDGYRLFKYEKGKSC